MSNQIKITPREIKHYFMSCDNLSYRDECLKKRLNVISFKDSFLKLAKNICDFRFSDKMAVEDSVRDEERLKKALQKIDARREKGMAPKKDSRKCSSIGARPSVLTGLRGEYLEKKEKLKQYKSIKRLKLRRLIQQKAWRESMLDHCKENQLKNK